MSKDPNKVIGMKELDEAFRSLVPMTVGQKGYPKNALRNASRTMAKVVEEAARAKAPTGDGNLKKSLTTKLMDMKYRDMAILQGNSKEYYYVGHYAGDGRDEDGAAYYGSMVEKGHFATGPWRKTGKKASTWVPAQPHIRPALEENKYKLPNVFGEKLRKDLLKIAKKLGDDNRAKLLSHGVKL